MDILWSASTTMRNPERTKSFLITIKEVEGEIWNTETQIKLQSLLIKNRFYKPTDENLNDKQIKILEDLNYDMSYDEAYDIFISKKYNDPPMRGRTTFDPIEKMGLAYLENDGENKIVKISSLGDKFLKNELTLNDVIFNNLLKFQYPNPLTDDCKDYNVKPFICILHLIKKVNEICIKNNEKAKGVSKDEFGIFCLSIKNYLDIDKIANDLMNYRHEISKIKDTKEKNLFRDNFVSKYLSTYKEPVENTKEYSDNIIRYLRMTKYIIIRGNGYYIDLEPRRNIEIESLLNSDNGSAKQFTEEEYIKYLSDVNSYVLPFETEEELEKIAVNIIQEINDLSNILNLKQQNYTLNHGIDSLKKQIENLREDRSVLQNQLQVIDFNNEDKIEDAIESLTNYNKLGMKPSVALEKWAAIALNIIDDARAIKSNAPMGDDYEPTFTAPAGVPDIECIYGDFGLTCEVTTLSSRDQWFSEGQPVMRHLRDFEDKNSDVNNYCIFVAPKIHEDTLNTFWTAVKYEYQGQKQKIIPFTISDLVDILNIFKRAKHKGIKIKSNRMKEFYDSCVDISNVKDSLSWRNNIKSKITSFSENIGA